jgi:hypothetical protein
VTHDPAIDEIQQASGVTRRAVLGRSYGLIGAALLCKLPTARSTSMPMRSARTVAFRYRGVGVRIMEHGKHSMLSLRPARSRRWYDMDHLVFMRMDDGTYVSCLYCTAQGNRDGRRLAKRLIRDNQEGLFNLFG